MLLEILCSLIVLIAYLLWQRRKTLETLKDFTGPTALPLIGNLPQLTSIRDVLWVNVAWSKIYKNYLLFLGLKPCLLVTDHKLAELLLCSNKLIEKSNEYKIVLNWLGDGLLIRGGIKWRKRRKILTPAFHYNILDNYIEIFESKGIILIEKLKEKVGLDSVDVFDLISLFTLDVICETAMGTEMDSQRDADSICAKSVKELCDIAFQKLINPLYRVKFIYSLTNLGKKEKNAIDVVHGFAKSVIQSRRKSLQYKENGSEEFSVHRKLIFLDILLQATSDGKPLTDEDILDEVEVFMFEGHDTTSIAISVVLYFLSLHSEVQKKVVDELNDIFQGNKTKILSQQDFHEMKYLEMVIKESLRLCPPITLQGRKITEDTIFEGKRIPKGLTVAINTFALHRHAENFPDPEKFDPERFNKENQTNRHPFAYIPFSAGPRNCIGQKFAMLEMKSCISKILMNFKVFAANIPDYKPEYMYYITTKSMTGMKIRLENRE